MGLFSRKRKLCRTHYESVMSGPTNEALNGRFLASDLQDMVKNVEMVDFQKCVLCKEVREEIKIIEKRIDKKTKDMTDEEREKFFKEYRYDN